MTLQYKCTHCTTGGSDNVGSKTGNHHVHGRPNKGGFDTNPGTYQ